MSNIIAHAMADKLPYPALLEGIEERFTNKLLGHLQPVVRGEFKRLSMLDEWSRDFANEIDRFSKRLLEVAQHLG